MSNRYQGVVLNGQVSSWADVKAGVPQGSILGPSFFLIYINDLSGNLKSTVKLSASDASIFHVVKTPNTSEKLTFNDHITSKLTTINKLISTLRKPYHYMPCDSFVTIYKSFIRPT